MTQEQNKTNVDKLLTKAPEGYKPNRLYIESKSKHMQMLIQPSLHEKLRGRAQEEGYSVNALIHALLEEAIANNIPTKSPAAECSINDLHIETKSKRLAMLIQPSLHEKLRSRAQEEGCSVNALMHALLENTIANNIPPKAPPAECSINDLYIETKSKILQIRMRPSLYAKLSKRAREEGCGVSTLLHTILEEALSDY